jgi:hypothetical protein
VWVFYAFPYRERFYFGEITVLVPQSWSYKDYYETAQRETFPSSDIRIVDSDLYGVHPLTAMSGDCGEFGFYTSYSRNLFPDALHDLAIEEAKVLHSKGKRV